MQDGFLHNVGIPQGHVRWRIAGEQKNTGVGSYDQQVGPVSRRALFPSPTRAEERTPHLRRLSHNSQFAVLCTGRLAMMDTRRKSLPDAKFQATRLPW